MVGLKESGPFEMEYFPPCPLSPVCCTPQVCIKAKHLDAVMHFWIYGQQNKKNASAKCPERHDRRARVGG